MKILVLEYTTGEYDSHEKHRYIFEYESEEKFKEDFLALLKQDLHNHYNRYHAKTIDNYKSLIFCGDIVCANEILSYSFRQVIYEQGPQYIDTFVWTDFNFDYFGTLQEYVFHHGVVQSEVFKDFPNFGLEVNISQ